ncbi:MAG: hypothetical protein ACYDA4_16465 [Ignavibacteriaceae bacterium]
MHKQINTSSLNFQNIIPGEGITKTFQKNKSKQELLERGCAKTTMNYAHVANLGAGVRSPLEG